MEYRFHSRLVHTPPLSGHLWNSSHQHKRLSPHPALVRSTGRTGGPSASVEPNSTATARAVEIPGYRLFMGNNSNSTVGAVRGSATARARRLTGYHQYGGRSSGHPTRPLVSIEQSDEAVRWLFGYERALRGLETKQPELYRTLMRMEKRLNRFCYSMLSLSPTCTQQVRGETKVQYVFRQSAHGLPVVDPLAAGNGGSGAAGAIKKRVVELLNE